MIYLMDSFKIATLVVFSSLFVIKSNLKFGQKSSLFVVIAQITLLAIVNMILN